MTARMHPTPAQVRFLETGQGTKATREAARCAGWCDRDGKITEAGAFVLAEMRRAA